MGISASAPAPIVRKSLGFSVGGAKDANNFYENIKHGYLPKINSITYEGVFYEHRFNLQPKECKELFCPNYESAVRNNIFNDKKEYFLAIGLDSNIKKTTFKRKKLNLVVVLDISGSMGGFFDSYYYDKKIKIKNNKKTKMQIANQSISYMTKHLKDMDSFGVVLFDDRAYLAKPLRKVALTDMEAIREHILKLKPRGGTNWSAGYKKGLELFKSIEKDPEVENRIIFITDAMPNRGELAKDRLFGMIKDASKDGVYTTVIGVGVDFNNDLVEYITKIRGANYLSIHSEEEFKRRVDKEFDYLVTPLVYDLKLKLLTDSFIIKHVYGTATNQTDKNTLIKVNTLFPSPTDKEGVKGGIILVQLDKKDKGSDINLKVSYKDRDGKVYENIKKVKFDTGYYYGGSAVQKAIVLADYVNIIRNWLTDTRKSCNDKVSYPSFEIMTKRCLYPPTIQNSSTWERKSCKLEISKGYRKLLYIFLKEFQKQKYLLRDSSLKKEENLLKLLLKKSKKKDDWRFVR
jgi:Ca-activated chloride channel family protein